MERGEGKKWWNVIQRGRIGKAAWMALLMKIPSLLPGGSVAQCIALSELREIFWQYLPSSSVEALSVQG